MRSSRAPQARPPASSPASPAPSCARCWSPAATHVGHIGRRGSTATCPPSASSTPPLPLPRTSPPASFTNPFERRPQPEFLRSVHLISTALDEATFQRQMPLLEFRTTTQFSACNCPSTKTPSAPEPDTRQRSSRSLPASFTYTTAPTVDGAQLPAVLYSQPAHLQPLEPDSLAAHRQRLPAHDLRPSPRLGCDVRPAEHHARTDRWRPLP